MPSRLHRYDVPGHVHFWTLSCCDRLTFFWHDDLKRVAVEGLRLLSRKFDVCLIGYVIMPEHVHVLFLPHARGASDPIPVSRLLHSFKQYTGFHGKERLLQLRDEHERLWAPPIEAWVADAAAPPFWTTRGHDFNVDRYETLREKLDYCHKNPLTRG